MKTARAKPGVSLMEMTVVVASVALLVSLSTPAIRTFFDSLTTRDTARAMIDAALSSARATAAKEQRYAGIRFQKAYHPQGPLYGFQYMIFIMHDPEATTLASGFRAVQDLKPVKLPEGVGVMDLKLGTVFAEIDEDPDISLPWQLTDTTSFSVVFSPSGKMLIHDVRIRNRDGIIDSSGNVNLSLDDVFNKKAQVDTGNAMFYQDDYSAEWWSPYPNLGLGGEASRSSFVIYEEDKFQQAYQRGQAYSGYLRQLVSQMVYINSYTGRIISGD